LISEVLVLGRRSKESCGYSAGFMPKRRAIEILQDGRHVGVERGADGIGDKGFAVFGPEHQMDMETGQGLRHR
jgi:hypothetical protein